MVSPALRRAVATTLAAALLAVLATTMLQTDRRQAPASYLWLLAGTAVAALLAVRLDTLTAPAGASGWSWQLYLLSLCLLTAAASTLWLLFDTATDDRTAASVVLVLAGAAVRWLWRRLTARAAPPDPARHQSR